MTNTIEVQAKLLHGWEAYELSAGQLKVAFIPLGGRMISLQFCQEEFFFVQAEHVGESFDFGGLTKEQIEAEKSRLGFRLWGGDKSWVAPQSKWSQAIPPLVLDAGSYKVKIQGQKISLQSPLDPETGLQICREITLHSNHKLDLKQSFYNHSEKTVEFGIWDVSQILRSLYVYIPTKMQALIPYPEEGDSEALLGQVCSTVANGWSCIRCDEPLHFKYGALPKKGQIISFKPSRSKNSFLIMERFFDVDPKAQYAHGAAIEVYNSPTMNYAEVEVHGPLQSIAPGESIQHSQTWCFREAKREEAREITSIFKAAAKVSQTHTTENKPSL